MDHDHSRARPAPDAPGSMHKSCWLKRARENENPTGPQRVLFEQLPVLESYTNAGCDTVKSNAPGILQHIERRCEQLSGGPHSKKSRWVLRRFVRYVIWVYADRAVA